MVSNDSQVFSRLILALVFFGGITGSAICQDTVPVSEGAKIEERDVVFALRVENDMTGAQIEETFQNAFRSTGTKAQSVTATPIDHETYDKIKEFLTTVKSTGELERKGIIAQRSSRSNYWDIYLPDGYTEVEKMEVEYQLKSSLETKKEELIPISKAESLREKDPKKRLIYQGLTPPQLELRSDPDWILKGYQVVLKGRSDALPGKTLSQKFAESRCYRLEIVGYTGSMQKLFNTVGNEKAIGFAMKGLYPPKTLGLGLADLVGTIAPRRGAWEKNYFQLNELPPSNPPADRAWVLFPLSKEDAEKLKTQLDTDFKDGKLTLGRLSESLKSGELGGYKVSNTAGDITLRANEPAKWYEMGNVNASKPGEVPAFQRTFMIGEIADWKKDPRSQGAWRVVMFEYDTRFDGSNEKTGARTILRTSYVGDKGESRADAPYHIERAVGWETGDSPFSQAIVPTPTLPKQ